MALSNRINMRGGGDISRNLLAPLNQLGRSYNFNVSNSYCLGVNYTGTFNPNYVAFTNVTTDSALIAQSTGYAVGFVTNCESEKTYQWKGNINGATYDSVVFFMEGSTQRGYVQVQATGTGDFEMTFTVPQNCKAVLLPRRVGDGTFTYTHISLNEI